MTNIWATKAKFGILGPSTNTVVEPDFDALRPDGVTNHYSRIYTPDTHALSNESFLAGTKIISDNMMHAVRSVMTLRPTYLVMGMSAITFYGGLKGAEAFRDKIRQETNLDVSCGSLACRDALIALGNVSRISFLSPYFPAANEQVRQFFIECGFEVENDACLQSESWTKIAEINEATLTRTIDEIDAKNVDAIVQVGTNLSMLKLAANLEATLAKPVIAINAATYWHALRAIGITDQKIGWGRLMERH